MGRLSKRLFANIGVTSFCVCCPCCDNTNDIEIDTDDNIIIFPEEDCKIISCKKCGSEINVLATQIFETDINDPKEAAEAIAKREAFTHPDRVRQLEHALWSLCFAVSEESLESPKRNEGIQEALQRGRALIRHKDAEFRPLVEPSPGSPTLSHVTGQ